MREQQELPNTETEDIESLNAVNLESQPTVEPLKEQAKPVRSKFTPGIKGIGPGFKAYLEQWPRTFLTWFLTLLALSLLVWRFIPGSDILSGFTPAQGLIIPVTVFLGPAILAAFIATHNGIEWYSNTVAVKGIGLAVIDVFLKLRALVLKILPFNNRQGKTANDKIADLSFPGIGYEAFNEKYLHKNAQLSSEEVLEAVTQYQLEHMGSIAINFFIVYVLIKLPAIILWEAASLTLEWGVYQAGFWLAHIPFPTLTLYHWQLFVLENLAVAFVIFFQEIKIDTNKAHIQHKDASLAPTKTLKEDTQLSASITTD